MRKALILPFLAGALMVMLSLSFYGTKTLHLEEGTYEIIGNPSNLQVTPANLCISTVDLKLREVQLKEGVNEGKRYLLSVKGRGVLKVVVGNETRVYSFEDGGYVPLPEGRYNYSIEVFNASLKAYEVLDMSPRHVKAEVDGNSVFLPEGEYYAIISGKGRALIRKHEPNVLMLVAGLALILTSLLKVIRGANSGRGN